MSYGSKKGVEKRPERTEGYVRTSFRQLTPLPCGNVQAGDGRKTAGSEVVPLRRWVQAR